MLDPGVTGVRVLTIGQTPAPGLYGTARLQNAAPFIFGSQGEGVICWTLATSNASFGLWLDRGVECGSDHPRLGGRCFSPMEE